MFQVVLTYFMVFELMFSYKFPELIICRYVLEQLARSPTAPRRVPTLRWVVQL